MPSTKQNTRKVEPRVLTLVVVVDQNSKEKDWMWKSLTNPSQKINGCHVIELHEGHVPEQIANKIEARILDDDDICCPSEVGDELCEIIDQYRGDTERRIMDTQLTLGGLDATTESSSKER